MTTEPPEDGRGEWGSALFPAHREYLSLRGVTPEVARERGYRTADTKAQLGREGFGPAQRLAPGLVVPIWNVVGERAGVQLRPDSPRNVKGKPAKFETRAGQAMLLDVPPRVRGHLADPARPLVITEGPVKADAAVSSGLDCIAVIGVWAWRGTNQHGGKVALADWEDVALNDRLVVVAFDSDVMLKPEVHGALARFGDFLALRQARVAYAYLPHGEGGAKIGLDDWLAAGNPGTALFDLATPQLRTGHFTPPNNRATVQPPPPAPTEPPRIAFATRILDRFKHEVQLRGLVGEERNAATLYLVLTSRFLEQQVSAGVKGHSASGKSYTVDTTLRFFPDDEVIEFTGMSERALVYSPRDYRHKTLVIYEAVGLREGNDDNQTAYFVRSLLSEGRIRYEQTVKGDDGAFTTRYIEKDGPTNLIFTTTKTHVHAENETRVLSLNTDDTRDQTARVFLELAKETGAGTDLDEWLTLQRWLAGAEHRVTIPYATTLAENIPPLAIRLRRDFGALLALIRAHAVLHQSTRERDPTGCIIATLDDYTVVRDLVADAIAAGVEATVPPVVRDTVTAVADIVHGDQGVMARDIATQLDLDKSTVSRRLSRAAREGYLRNLEDKRGRPARWVIGDPMPEDVDLLPQPHNLTPNETAGQGHGCTVARDSEGGKEAPRVDPPSVNGGPGHCSQCHTHQPQVWDTPGAGWLCTDCIEVF
jgi:hypothetical protein